MMRLGNGRIRAALFGAVIGMGIAAIFAVGVGEERAKQHRETVKELLKEISYFNSKAQFYEELAVERWKLLQRVDASCDTDSECKLLCPPGTEDLPPDHPDYCDGGPQ